MMTKPDLITRPSVTVVDHEGSAAIRTEETRGDPNRGGGTHVEFLTFHDPKEGLRIARDLAEICLAKVER